MREIVRCGRKAKECRWWGVSGIVAVAVTLAVCGTVCGQVFEFDSASLVITGGRPVSGRKVHDLSKAVALNMHKLTLVAAAHRAALPSAGGYAVLSVAVGADGAVSAARMGESTLGDSTVNAAVVRSIAGWRFPPAAEQTELVEFSFKVNYRATVPDARSSSPARAPVRVAPAELPGAPTYHERQRAIAAITVLGGLGFGTALASAVCFAIRVRDLPDVERVCRVVGGAMAGTSVVSFAAATTVGIRFGKRVRRARLAEAGGTR